MGEDQRQRAMILRMTSPPLPEPFRTFVETCFRNSCWASSWDSWEGFASDHVSHLPEEDQRRLRQQWADAIVHGTVRAEQLRAIHPRTILIPDDDESVREFLATCWRIFHHREDHEDFATPKDSPSA